ncbi:[FeFe] hydrogenase H-cluster maturation GTPase HydF [Ihubacter sp. rT4E-8]|uniref:[FeFe] hydrogenase H-cluster maturation GTPase HydF n=1 Tax=unclassified Ihubacter TaxID=2633299 RepID=UPI003C7BEBC4
MAKETSDFNKTPSANRLHISFFGRRNAGKSSLVNAVTGQDLAIVSDVKGTTTDPVKKAMELLPLGPVVIIDTPGIDDSGAVGEKRVEKTLQILNKTDIAVLVVDQTAGMSAEDEALVSMFQKKKTPFLLVFNKGDLPEATKNVRLSGISYPYITVSALTGQGIEELKNKLASIAKSAQTEDKKIIGDRLPDGGLVILVTPIDSSAPKGRMILPQVQTIRDILDAHASCMVCQVSELPGCLSALKEPPALVVTDSQAFNQVKDIVPEDVKLTSFSILFARYKGILDTASAGAHHLSALKDGDRILISEGCTHHRQCEDIGTVKLPDWICRFSGKDLTFEFTSGGEFPQKEEALKQYALIVHCGGCMLNEREMESRMSLAQSAGTAFTNYGTLIAHINGILDRSLEIFNA